VHILVVVMYETNALFKKNDIFYISLCNVGRWALAPYVYAVSFFTLGIHWVPVVFFFLV